MIYDTPFGFLCTFLMILHQGFLVYSFSYTYIGIFRAYWLVDICFFEVGLSLNFYCIIGSAFTLRVDKGCRVCIRGTLVTF
jgi:hypothetical protein